MNNGTLVPAGSLGSLISAGVDTKERVDKANDIINSAITHPDLGKSSWKIVREKWYEVLNVNPVLAIDHLVSAFNEDTADPTITNINKTSLGKYFAATLLEAFAKSKWNAPGDQLVPLGNSIAVKVYSARAPDALAKFQVGNPSGTTVINNTVPASSPPVSNEPTGQTIETPNNQNADNSSDKLPTDDSNGTPSKSTPTQEKASKSNMLLYAGIGVGAAALLVTAYVMTRNKKGAV